MVTTQTIIAYVEELAGHPLNSDEGVQHGTADREVGRILVSWMATPDALERAGAERADLVLTHESLYYPYDAAVRGDNPPGWQDWRTNRQRRKCLERHDLTLLRVHGSLDEICIFDDFASALGLGQPIEAEKLAKVYEVPPCSLSELVARVKARVNLCELRVSCPGGMGQIVRRVGLPWGGLGLFTNVGYQQQLIGMGCDVFIAGESDSYGYRFSAECGIPMIETGHEISENPGLLRFALMLEKRFPGLKVTFHECQPVFHTV